MWSFRVALAVLVLALLPILTPQARGETASSVHAQPARAPSATLGYISRATRGIPDTRPTNRYLDAIRQTIAKAGGFSTIDVAHDPSVPTGTLAFCRAKHLIGYVEPAVGFRSQAGSAIASGNFEISDCRGRIVYANFEQQSEAAGRAAEDVSQIDKLETRVALALGRAFSNYVSAHRTAWEGFLSGGESFESAADQQVVAQFAKCAQRFQAKDYRSVISTCTRVALQVKSIVQRIDTAVRVRDGSDIDRHYVQAYGSVVAGVFTMLAIAEAKLGDSAAGRPSAQFGARWAAALIAYFVEQFPNHTSARFIAATNPLKAFAADLEASYPGIVETVRPK
jgi:hypothetical protein